MDADMDRLAAYPLRVDNLAAGLTWDERKEIMERTCKGCHCPTNNPYHENCHKKLEAAIVEYREEQR